MGCGSSQISPRLVMGVDGEDANPLQTDANPTYSVVHETSVDGDQPPTASEACILTSTKKLGEAGLAMHECVPSSPSRHDTKSLRTMPHPALDLNIPALDCVRDLGEGAFGVVTCKKLFRTMPRPTLDLNVPTLQYVRDLGEGAFGVVTLRCHRQTSRLVAVKTLLRDLSPAQYSRYTLERDILAKVRHPFVVEMVGAYHDESQLLLALEYIEGGDLFAYMDARNQLRLSEQRLIAASVTIMLEHLHSLGVLYDDLKPENLMVTPNGYLKLIDFGCCKEIGLAPAAMASHFSGTFDYASPECLQSSHGFPADWWSLGILLFECHFNATPYEVDGVARDGDAEEDQAIWKRLLNPSFMRDVLHRLQGEGEATPEAVSLIRALTAFEPSERPKGERVRQDAFFDGMSFEDLLAQRLPASKTLDRAEARVVVEEAEPVYGLAELS